VPLTFAVKARNAKEKGAIAVVIINRADATDYNWSLPSPATPVPAEDKWTLTYAFPLTVGISFEQGDVLAKKGSGSLALGTGPDDYAVFNGTSMASPHVAGAIAMIWSLAPNATGEQVVTSLVTTVRDLGTTGVDPVYGFGLIDIFSAGKLLAPHAFGAPVQPSKKPTTGRAIGRRG
jgi:serine protease